MAIPLTPELINQALQKPEFKKGLEHYLQLQALTQSLPAFYADPNFRKEFNGFYRIRRDADWQEAFFQLMADAKDQPLTFREVLTRLHAATGQYEASFASKLVATLDPTAPIIDSTVLTLLGFQLPPASEKNHYKRLNAIEKIHQDMTALYAEFRTTDLGKYLHSAFRRAFPDAGDIAREKMLDLVLGQTKLPKPVKTQW